MELQNCMTDMLSTLASSFGDKALMLVDKDGTPAGHILGTEMVGAMEYEREKGKWFPDGYTELAYLSGDGTPYIDTGIVPSPTHEVEVDMKLLGTSSGAYIFGRYASNEQYYLYLSSGRLQWGWNCNYITTSIEGYDSQRHVYGLSCKDGTSRFSIDQTVVGTRPALNQTTTLSFTLFRGGQDSMGGGVGQTFYSSKIRNNGTIISYLVPAKRNSDGEVGLYDLQRGVFLTNAGTGTFGYGEL